MKNRTLLRKIVHFAVTKGNFLKVILSPSYKKPLALIKHEESAEIIMKKPNIFFKSISNCTYKKQKNIFNPDYFEIKNVENIDR
jgi:hypothetical protein